MRRLTRRAATAILGTSLLAIGGIGDLIYHMVPPLSQHLVPFVGQDGDRAHLVTAAGVGVLLFTVLYKALMGSEGAG